MNEVIAILGFWITYCIAIYLIFRRKKNTPPRSIEDSVEEATKRTQEGEASAQR